MTVLQVVEQGFRTVVEEQDDAILWLIRSMQSAGAELKVLLTGHAATYAVLTRRQPALELGKWRQSEPAELTRDLRGVLGGGAPVHVVAGKPSEGWLAGVAMTTGGVVHRISQ